MYKVIKCIGSGSYGNVYIVRHNENKYAMKRVRIIKQSRKEKINLVNEIRILKYCKCPFILNFIDCKFNGYNIEIITSMIRYGDLHKVIKRRNGKKFSETKIWSYFIQTSMAIEYLHKNNIIHRDVKTSNIFLDHGDRIILGDFGVSKILLDKQFTSTCIGTPYYMSPELFAKQSYSKEVDIWALGCVLYELITFTPPFTANNMNNLSRKVIAMKFSSTINLYKNRYSHELLNLIPKFFCKSTSRILINDMMESAVITNHKNCLPDIEEKNENIADFREKFKNIYSNSWVTITKDLGKPQQIKVTNVTRNKILPSLKQYKPTAPKFIPKSKKRVIKYKHNALKPIQKKIQMPVIKQKPPWVIPTHKKSNGFGKPPLLPKISEIAKNYEDYKVKHGLYGRYDYRDKYKKIYNKRSPFIYN